MYFETHAHYDFKQFNDDRDELLARILPDFGISHIINVGTSMRSSRDGLALANKYDYIYATLGVHPHNAKDIGDGDIDKLADMALDPKVVAIGEIGLDFYYDHSPRDIQIKRFKQMLGLGIDLDMPLVIHCRDAEQETFDILKESRAGERVGGVMHCFSHNAMRAQKYFELGWHIGVGGVVTYKNAQILRDVVAITPRERLLLETDCPYLSPDPNRGKRNDSCNLQHIAEKIAEIWDTTPEEVARVTTENAKRLFRI